MILKLQTLSLKITSIIRNLGEDVNREGILSTPVRAAANAVFNSWIWTRPTRDSKVCSIHRRS
jgi:GTP cyclohydrolase I